MRAEILGAFFNAVFLIALCVSIILEALTRFVEPPEINNPKLILIVGCAGLFSNLVGFVVLGGHGHSHGPGDHAHEHGHAHDEADYGHVSSHGHDEEEGLAPRGITSEAADESGPVGDVLPEAVVERATKAGEQPMPQSPETQRRIHFGGKTSTRDDSNSRGGRTSMQSRGRDRRRSSKSGHSRFTSIEDMSIHPASFRQDIIAASKAASSSAAEEDNGDDVEVGTSCQQDEQDVDEESPLLKDAGHTHGTLAQTRRASASRSRRHSRRDSSVHAGHNHTLPKKPSKNGHGHSHGDMGMNAMILHVIGDALGNVGVIVTALIIWLTDLPGKYYADPAVSLFITGIILNTSIPLTRATSKVLLQATPEHISIPEIREDIEALPGVVSCHHIHVWQLSDTKVVASMHLQVSFPINSDKGARYMELAKRARICLHAYGIHSATIQPEFCPTQNPDDTQNTSQPGSGGAVGPLDQPNPDVCLLECVENCAEPGCCRGLESSSGDTSTRCASDSSHSNSSPHRHS